MERAANLQDPIIEVYRYFTRFITLEVRTHYRMEWPVIAKILTISLLLAVNAFVTLPAAALPYLEYYLVESQNGVPADMNTVLVYSKHDLPGLTGPETGFQASHSVLWPGNSDYVLQTFSAPPFKQFVPTKGDGGQLLYYNGQFATGIETRDGGTSKNQYFAPAGCPVNGWLFFNTDYVPQGQWGSAKATLVNVPEPTGNCPSPSTAYTRWRLELVSMFFLFNGKPSWQEVWVIVSEHYAGPSIGESQTMERDFFAYGYGWIRWEGWTTNTLATRDPDLLGRCPGVYIKNGPWPLAEPAAGWVQTACRSWTNIIWDGDGKTTVGGISWAP